MVQPTKRLYRSRTDRMLVGVLGGLAEYAGIDPSVLRIGYVLFTFFTAAIPGILLYFIVALIVPAAPASDGND